MQVAAEVSEHIRNYLAVPANVGDALAAGVMAIQSSLPLFADLGERPHLSQGFLHLGSKLFDAVSMLISEETAHTEEYQNLKMVWEETAEALPATVESLAAGILKFGEEADIAALVQVCTAVINEMASLLTSVLPEEVSAEVVKYLGALEDAVSGFEEAMEEFTDGNTTGAVEAIYAGIRLATSELLPLTQEGQEAQNDDTAVFEALDAVFEGLSSTVLKYRQQLLQSQVCWKSFVRRDRRRPDQCPSHLNFDGNHWCIQGEPAILEAAASRKKSKGAVAPGCVDDSDFNEKRGSWCYMDCPYGSEPAGNRCKPVCMGGYPIDSPLMCGRSPGTIAAAITEMTVRTLRGIVKLASLAAPGVGVMALPGTIRSLIDAGKSFVHPKCPILGD